MMLSCDSHMMCVFDFIQDLLTAENENQDRLESEKQNLMKYREVIAFMCIFLAVERRLSHFKLQYYGVFNFLMTHNPKLP